MIQIRHALLGALMTTAIAVAPACAQTTQAPTKEEFTPQVGQAGKDVIWVPTPDALVDRMLRLAQVTPNDFVVDLGSGDGKIVVAAARNFKAKSLGVEFNPDMVQLARRNAEKAGVANLASFDQGDIFKYDYSNATVVTMYLLPSINLKLRPTLLQMRPGTRLVTHQFTMGDWEPDDVSTVEGRPAYLWIVPANVGGSWRLSGAGGSNTEVSIDQTYQKISGAVRYPAIQATLRDPRLRGDQIAFTLVDEQGVLRNYQGTVKGNRIEGTATAASGGASAPFTMTRQGSAPAMRGSTAS